MNAAPRVMVMTEDPRPEDPALRHQEWMRQIANQRDRSAFAQLFGFFGPRVKSMMLRSGADDALAEDIVQDVMLIVWRKAALYRPERGSVNAWVFTVARNARIDRLRRRDSQPYQDVETLDLVYDGPSAETAVQDSQQASMIIAAMATLPDDQRRVIELAFLDDRSQSDIAAHLSLPLGTVKSRLRLAYAKLRSKLKDFS